MKNTALLTALAAMLVSCSSVTATDSSNGRFETPAEATKKSEKLPRFDAIETGGVLYVKYVKADRYSIELASLDEGEIEKTEYRVENGTLTVQRMQNDITWTKHNNPEQVYVTITAPSLSAIRNGGVVRFFFFDDITSDSFILENSGASGIIGKSLKASSTINIENSGVSKMALDKLQADKVSIDNSGSSSIAVSSISAASSISVDNSGASKSSFSDLKATSAAIKSSGSSNLNITGIGVSHIAAKASGASKIALEGKAQDADYDSSGSSKVDASNLECNIANVESSGASSVKAYATNNAYVDSSRSSKVTIEGGANVVTK